MRVADGEEALLEGEAFAPEGKFRREVDRRGNVAACGEMDRLPIECSSIEGAFDGPTRFEGELQGATFERKGCSHIVVKDPTVDQPDLAGTQVKQGFCGGL